MRYGNLRTLVGAAALALLLSAPSSAAAQTFFQNGTGIASPTNTITFSEIPMASGTQIGSAYSSLGVTFSGVYYDPQSFSAPNIVSPSAGNFNFNNDPLVNPYSIHFNAVQTEAALAVITNTATTSFEALLNGTVVASGSAATNTVNPNNFFGFTGGSFNEIRVTVVGSNGFSLFDNIEFNATPTQVTPEPISLALFAPGLAVVGFLKRRKKDEDESEA
jgi:hypothetical protein